jgi:Mn2+/Fe2+ NRAMP family transporter
MAALLVANFATTVSEFAGILAAVQIFVPGLIARFVVLPIVACGVYAVVTRGSYKRLERILLGASLIYLFYIVSAFLAHPNWGQALHRTVLPDIKAVNPLGAYIFMIINVVGTTITPWGQFYIQSSVRDKGIQAKDYALLRMDVFFGAFFTNFIAYFIIVCCGATLFVHGIHTLTDAGQAAQALAPLAGRLATILFAIGLFNASCFGAITVPLSTAYAVTESLGWESGVGRRTKEAPLFVGIFSFLVAASALLVALFPQHLTFLIILPNLVGAVLLPIILVMMLLLVNKRRLMGRFVNTPVYNIIAWATAVILVGLSLILLFTQLFPPKA